ncbi:MAG: hypothetical protein GAK45_00625 [Pseudomonas citronellolis]|nr:MAG: hypothetical protein GAK45_00625 [Pseudomonas citronellolis]
MFEFPEKSEVLAAILAWLVQHFPVFYAATLSFWIAVLRILAGGGTRSKALMEGALCGAMTVTLIGGLEFFGLPSTLATFVGGWVGFLGVEKIRALAERYAEGRLRP